MGTSHKNGLHFPYVLFDLGNTLIYFDGDWPVVIQESILAATRSLRSLGYDLDEERFPASYYALTQEYYQKRSDGFVEYTARSVLEQALRRHGVPDPRPEHLEQALAAMYAVSQAHWQPEQDAVPVLETLRARGCRLGIVSNASDDADVQVLVDKAGLRPYLDFVLTSARAGYRKPSPQIFRQALEHWDASPQQAVMVGDLLEADVAGANGLGMGSVWIARRVNTPENHEAARAYRPDATIYTLEELPGVLENWPGH